jgi:leucyl-tRNA synthetase/predicted esterase
MGKDDSRFILLHGREGSPKDNFFPWLKEELEKRGYEVEAPDLPGTNEPDDEEQTTFVEKNCKIDDKTVIVGHSFGGIVALRLLERGHAVRRVVLAASVVSGKFNDGKIRASVTRACEKGFDFKKIRNNAQSFFVMPDSTDKIVPIEDAQTLARELSAIYMVGTGNRYHFTDAKEPDLLMACTPTIRVFTTRPDTLFGATYLVLAPEHPWVSTALEHKTVLKNNDEVAKYVKAASKKTELERQQDTKDKTGVKLEGVEAVNPATGERIPLYVADYVLGHYGTGAIMAVPAHDGRDFAFAKKFKLPIKQVVAHVVRATSGGDAVREDMPWKERNAVMAIVKHWDKDEYLCLDWKDHAMRTFPSGGIEGDEDPATAAAREVSEETGYQNVKLERQLGGFEYLEFYHQIKRVNIRARFRYFAGRLENGEKKDIAPEEAAMHHVVWKKREELPEFLLIKEKDRILDLLDGAEEGAYTGDGYLVNSGGYDGRASEAARKEVTGRYGRAKKTYRLRDWIVSRQRYWGVPIPIIHCGKCGAMPVPEKELPVELPPVKDYLPDGKGRSPLAKVKKFVQAECPKCGGKAERETDTLDTFVDSSWYFLRYTDSRNSKAFASKAKQAHWMPVDLYSGGAEHTTMHLLYSRFWHKALFDMELVADKEPYKRRMNRSIILGPDGQKMSKSHGNVIDPDEAVDRLGADTVRLYLAFIGPYNEVSAFPWNPDGVVGVRRFLERVWRLQEKVSGKGESRTPLLHKTIKKVGEDIAAQKFNTAISQLMILLNDFEKRGVSEGEWAIFLRLLAPFAPHMAEELWSLLGNKRPVHVESWPEYDEAAMVEDEITYAIQIDGKTRGEVRVAMEADKNAVERAARDVVASRLAQKEVTRVIVVPKRIINFILKD